LIAATKNGVSSGAVKMPAYAGKLTDAEIDAVVAYIQTLKK
jgi:mono/diheme cytochrome c family protein